MSVDEQVANMTSVVQKADQDLVPLIDIETTGGVSDDKFVSDLQEFVDRIATYYARSPFFTLIRTFTTVILSVRSEDIIG